MNRNKCFTYVVPLRKNPLKVLLSEGFRVLVEVPSGFEPL